MLLVRHRVASKSPVMTHTCVRTPLMPLYHKDTGFDVIDKVRCRVVDVTEGSIEADIAVFVVDTSRASALSAELGVIKTGIIVAKLSLDVPGGHPNVDAAKEEYVKWATDVEATAEALSALKASAAANTADAAAGAAAVDIVPAYTHMHGGAESVTPLGDVGTVPTGLDAIMTAPTAVPPPPALEAAMLAAQMKWGTADDDENINNREWTLRSIGLFCEGRKLEDVLPYVNAVSLFNGRCDHRGFRHDPECQIQYPNGDRFFGQYVHGKRKGVGMYFFREGGMYVGNYAKGLRSGLGIHVTKVRPNLDT